MVRWNGQGVESRSMRQALWLGLVLVLASAPALAADPVKVTVAGVDGEARANVSSYLGKLTTDDLRNWRASRPRLLSAAREAMEAMGFYGADVRVEQRDGSVIVSVTPGEPVRVARLRLVFQGEAGNDIAFTVLRESLPLKEGDVFHHGRYEAIKTAVQSLALERGYFDASWVHSEALVDPEAKRVDIDLVHDSGPRFAFGPVRFIGPDGEEQSIITTSLLERLVPFREGEPYDAAQVLKLNQSLLDTRYFNEVRVRQQRDEASGSQVPIGVYLAGEDPNDMDVGVGYSTDVEARLSLAWRRPRVNDRGHSIRASTELSAVRRSFDSDYTIPWKHPIDDVVQLVYGVQREDVEDMRADLSSTDQSDSYPDEGTFFSDEELVDAASADHPEFPRRINCLRDSHRRGRRAAGATAGSPGRPRRRAPSASSAARPSRCPRR